MNVFKFMFFFDQSSVPSTYNNVSVNSLSGCHGSSGAV